MVHHRLFSGIPSSPARDPPSSSIPPRSPSSNSTSMSRSSSDISTRPGKFHLLLFQVPGGFITKLTQQVLSQSWPSKSCSNHIDIKVAELIVTAHSLFVHIVEVLVAETAEEGGVVGDPDVVLANPDSDAGLTDVAVAGHLGSNRSEERIVLLALRVTRSHQSDVDKGEQMLMVALVLKRTFFIVSCISIRK